MSQLKSRLSVAMIVKNEEKHLAKTLESLEKIYDELVIVDTGSTDKTKEIAAQFGAQIFDLTLDPFHFGKARNYSFEKCTGDWILWLDADDVIKNPQAVRKLMDEADPMIDGYWAIYNYAFDKRGLCTSQHWKERLLRNNGAWRWEGVLHEAILNNREIQILQTELFTIDHDKKDEDFQRSTLRNYSIISKWIDQEGEEKTDPRNLLSLANACLGLNMYEEAIEWYGKFINRSGWNEEIYIAWHRAAMCLRSLKRYDDALTAEMEAIKIDPTIRDAYIGLGQTYMEMEKWEKAEHWLLASFIKQNQHPAPINNPAEYKFNPWWFLGHVYANMATEGKGHKYIEQALLCFVECKKVVGEDEEVDKRIKIFKDMIEDKEIADAVLKVGSYLKIEGEDHLKKLLEAIPDRVKSFPSVCKMRASVEAKKVSSGRDLVIFCGNCFEPWTPDSLLKGGVGGSEEAVIHMARLMKKRGWNVEVYNSIPEAKDFDGVMYKPWWLFNPHDAQDVFIGWRQPALFKAMKPNAKLSVCWMHDVVQPAEFTQDRLQYIDKVMFLSKHHRNLYAHVPESKVLLTANGLDLDFLDRHSEGVVKKKFKMINTSAPDRGIYNLLKMWPEIKKKYPEAELHWYYGWQSYDNYNQGNVERMRFKEEVQKLLKQDGVVDGGRITHDQVARQMAESDLWVYPTEFIETSCITAMKAQYLGCIPVTTDIGALSETVQYGVKLPYKDIYSNQEAQQTFIDSIGIALASTDRTQMKQYASKFSWEKVAKQWDEEFDRIAKNKGDASKEVS
jgi:glycosyltransferase involved in cell wall biosynthesis